MIDFGGKFSIRIAYIYIARSGTEAGASLDGSTANYFQTKTARRRLYCDFTFCLLVHAR